MERHSHMKTASTLAVVLSLVALFALRSGAQNVQSVDALIVVDSAGKKIGSATVVGGPGNISVIVPLVVLDHTLLLTVHPSGFDAPSTND